MPQYVITPEWVGSFQTGLRFRIQNGWDRVIKNLMWDEVMEVYPSQTLTEVHIWLLETANIHEYDLGGIQVFDNVVGQKQEITNKDSGTALRLTKNEIEDNVFRRNGMNMVTMDVAGKWADQIGKASAYRPQKQMFRVIKNGETTSFRACYDGKALFAQDHPVNPYDPSSGQYSNLLTGASSGAYPGACPITGVTLEQAVDNFSKAIGYTQTLKQPNGEPRMLRVRAVLGGPDMKERLPAVVESKFYGRDGSTEGMVSKWGINAIICDELTTPDEYYLVCEVILGEGGPIIWQERQGYVLTSYTPATQWELQQRKEFTWDYEGRNECVPGHPYLIFKVKKT